MNGNFNINKDYKPSEKEKYMNSKQMEYFRRKLITWKDEVIDESRKSINTLRKEQLNTPDLLDNASSELEVAKEIIIYNGYEKLINKINRALRRIENKTYGYCAESGNPIGIKRLEAVPIAILCVEDQERYERQKNGFRC
jgi:DnaK suppressor protein